MIISGIEPYCMAKPGVTKEYKAAWNMDLYRVGGKIFAETGGDRAETPILTVKLEPAFSELLRMQYPGLVVPGYYSNKLHWSSAYFDPAIPDSVFFTMMDQAYALVFSALPVKIKRSILP